MSFVNKAILKGNLDPSLAFFTSEQAFTTSELKIDSVTQFGAYIKEFRIVNQDSLNALQYRQGGTSAILKTVPPLSEVDVSGWESYVDIIPNGTSGAGFIEYDLVNLQDALKVKK